MEALEVGLQKKKVVISYEDEEYKSYIGISPPEDFLSIRFKLNKAKRGKMIGTLILEGYIAAGKKDDFSVNLQKVGDDYNFSLHFFTKEDCLEFFGFQNQGGLER